MQVVAGGQLVMVVAGAQVQVVLVEMVRVRTAGMQSRIIDIHQGVDGKTMIGCHLNGTRIVAVKETVYRTGGTNIRIVLNHTKQTVIKTGFFLKVQLRVEQRCIRHQLDWFYFHTMMQIRQMLMVLVMQLLMVLLLLLLLLHKLLHVLLQMLAVQNECMTLGVLLFLPERILLLESTPTSQVRSVVEHIVRVGIQCPVAALARFLVIARYLDKALVETEVVTDRVLPSLLIVAIVRKVLHDVLIDAVQRHFLVGCIADSLGDECNI